VSDHLGEVLVGPLRDLIPEGEFIDLFDRFEYLLALAYGDLKAGEQVPETLWAPAGAFVWRRGWRGDEPEFQEQIALEAREAGDGWGFLQGPLFKGSLDRFLSVQQAVDAFLTGLPMY
jgi:hypothetical protein